MKGDFSRSSFDPQKHYTSVRMQQGRVQLDADWNEQADITLHQLRTQLQDIIGKAGVPQSESGFIISDPTEDSSQLDFKINAGHCFVDGILCVNERDCKFTSQDDYPEASQSVTTSGKAYIAYFDVWERHLTALEDAAIGEVALNGVDTTTRTQTIWQAKVAEIDVAGLPEDDTKRWEFVQQKWQAFLVAQPTGGKLKVSLSSDSLIQQNQLYRVEIHTINGTKVSFKWSRENGSAVYAVVKIDKTASQSDGVYRYQVQLNPIDADKLYLERDDWTEITDDNDTRLNNTRPLLKVIDVQKERGTIILESIVSEIPQNILEKPQATHTLLRRWDQRQPAQQQMGDGAVKVEDSNEVELENGIKVSFTDSQHCRVGDYWLILARADLNDGLGGILWDNNNPQSVHGITHHFAPLALIERVGENWQPTQWKKLRFHTIPTLTADVAKLIERVDSAESKIEDLKGRVTKAEGDIEDLKGQIDSAESKIEDLKGRVTKAEGDIEDLKGQVPEVLKEWLRRNWVIILGIVGITAAIVAILVAILIRVIF